MFRLTITSRLVHEALAPLAQTGVPLELPLGVRRTAEGAEFVAPGGARSGRISPRLRLAAMPASLRGASHLYWHGFPVPAGGPPRVDLAIDPAGGCSGAVLLEGDVHPLEDVRVVGPRMERWIPGHATPAPARGAVHGGEFSRYAGALGGEAVHERLRRLSVAVVGTSRLGSGLSLALAKAGVGRIVLIDPDMVEPHHLDAMEVVDRRAVGLAKVDAVAAVLRAVAPSCDVTALREPLESAAALAAAADCSVIATAPDEGRPRLLAALAAVAYHRAHLDIGTAVQHADGATRAGADVRLTLPGEPCLLCAGGVDVHPRRGTPWWQTRLGSLRSLNAVAVGQAMLLLERLVAGTLASSTWARLDVRPDGLVESSHPPVGGRRGCPLCARAGLADGAWRPPGADRERARADGELERIVLALLRERSAAR